MPSDVAPWLLSAAMRTTAHVHTDVVHAVQNYCAVENSDGVAAAAAVVAIVAVELFIVCMYFGINRCSAV
jgi:hypothetical protein